MYRGRTREARTRNVDQRENVNHIGALADILIDEGSEDEFELAGEGNHNMSYDATGNNTIMSHPNINENSKTDSNPNKNKSTSLKKEVEPLKPVQMNICQIPIEKT